MQILKTFTFGDFLTLIGLLTFAMVAYHWMKLLFAHYVAHLIRLSYPFKKYGGWAVVTGATDGIGKGFANELAALGLNVVLIARDRQKLATVSARIVKKHRVQVNVIQADFTEEDVYERIERLLREVRVNVLVNNVGMCLPYPEYLHEIPDGDKVLLNLVRCNMIAATKMSLMCLPRMKHVRTGVIINISSASGLLPTPLVAAYSASKAYVDFLSRALQSEYADYGVTIQSVLPFTVQTKMSGNPEKNWFTPDPQLFARSTLHTAGVLSRTHGYFPHAIQGWYYSSLPEWLSSRMQRNFFVSLRETMLAQLKDAKKDNEE